LSKPCIEELKAAATMATQKMAASKKNLRSLLFFLLSGSHPFFPPLFADALLADLHSGLEGETERNLHSYEIFDKIISTIKNIQFSFLLHTITV
jgi:hypothetical protein